MPTGVASTKNWASSGGEPGALLRIGYEREQAARLALSRVDIHELEHLIGNGCPLETAVRIAA